MYAFINGEFIESKKEVIQIENRGFTFADGLFEVIRVHNYKPLFFKEHLQRMVESAKYLKIKFEYTIENIFKWAMKLASMNGITVGELYIELTRGVDKNREHRYPDKSTPSTLCMLCFPIRKISSTNWTDGTKVVLYPDLRHQLCEHKTINLLPNVLAKNHAYSKGAYEAIMWRKEENGKIYITEGGSSTYFGIKDEKLYTPKIENILPGITRKKVIHLAEQIKIEVKEQRVYLKDYLNYDEIFLVSTVSKVMPITRVENKKYKIGKITTLLSNMYEDLITQEAKGV